MINKLNENDYLILNGQRYSIEKVFTDSSERNTYLVRDTVHFFVIKELLPHSFILRLKIKRDAETNQAVFDNYLPDKDPFENNTEIISNNKAVQDKDNNSPFVFKAEVIKRLCPESAAIYIKIDSESGETFDSLRISWENLSFEELLKKTIELAIKTAEALSDLHIDKKLLHLDIKPQNLYSVKNNIKLLDFGSAMPVDVEKRTAKVVQSTVGFQSPLLGATTDIKSSDTIQLINAISVADDIFALAYVIVYMLTGTTKKFKIDCNSFNNSIYYTELMRILDKATFSKTIIVDSREFKTGGYESCDEFKAELENYLDVLNKNGLHEAVVLHNGVEHIHKLVKEFGVEIDEELIPEMERRE